jgi:hypothetical protein
MQIIFDFVKNNLMPCCKHKCKQKENLLLLPFLIHFLLHIVVGALLLIYTPNKYIVICIAVLDAVSHYAGILGFCGFIWIKLKNYFSQKP